MAWFSSFLILNLIGISTNIDNIGVGMAYGLKKMKIPVWFNIIINTIGFFTTIIGVFLGYVISQFISQKETGLVSFCILFCIGVFTIYNDWFVSKKREIKIQKLSIRQAVLLGFTLSITNIASGAGATVAYNSVIWSVIFSITVWGYIAIWFGNSVGNRVFSSILGHYSPLIAGFILIIIGFKQLF
ncbi:manganese efflux pump [Bacillus sp. FJAT-29814]|uniref:manganese efflux pump MntP n=1 Tax=Bacillus sp. FJAT-29814 TaxID=1729688 RepID=UPI000829E1BC|nr:manganese efflux pump [Bacillus sp. FJAT-29814]